MPRTRTWIAPALLGGLCLLGVAEAQTVKTFPAPAVTTWAPQGCRQVGYTDDVVPARRWTNLHADLVCSDEVSLAHAPVFAESWTVEPGLYSPTGPVFDAAGNLYVAPLLPYEDVVLVSLEPATGTRRWALAGTGAPPGGSAPMVLRDPATPGAEIVYTALYDRVVAVRTDGTIAWDVPSGLTVPVGADPFGYTVLGVNYVPPLDAVVAVTSDGNVYAVDRATGAALLAAPYALPGERTPPAPPSPLPPAVVAAADASFRTVVNVPPGGLAQFVNALLGNGTEVANMFAVDPWTGRLWVAATAPDAEDGTVDGVSQLGALYRLELVPVPGGLGVAEVCHRSFAGGSASTPTLSADGSRIYLGDNFGKLLAVEDDCGLAWEVDLGVQVFGSVTVPADRREIYAATAQFVAKVVDRGAFGELAWQAVSAPFENLAPGQQHFNLLLATAGANGLLVQSGVGFVTANGTQLPVKQGLGLLDRETGALRWFAEGGDESVAVASVGPDGVVHLANSPVRRLFANAAGLSPAPPRFGVTKFAASRLDLLARDAACAGAARAVNAHAYRETCADAAVADRAQVRELVAQATAAADRALAGGELDERTHRRVLRAFGRADQRLARDAERGHVPPRALRRAGRTLERACERFPAG